MHEKRNFIIAVVAMVGCAAFYVIAAAIARSGIKFGQLIEEGSWVHISIPNRGVDNGQVLTARFVDGKLVYSKGLRE